MKTIELEIWWSCGGDSDGYETDFEVSDEEYNNIVELVRKYAEENCDEEDEDIFIDPQEFTEKYFYKNARTLYDKIDKETTEEFTANTIATADEWFDEEEEGCTIEEYIENFCSCGFYFTEEFLASVAEG